MVFCNNVKPEAVTANGSHLVVPTTLPAGAAPSGYGLGAYVNDPFADICDLLSEVHYDSTGGDLGYSYVDVLDANGGGQAGCNVLR